MRRWLPSGWMASASETLTGFEVGRNDTARVLPPRKTNFWRCKVCSWRENSLKITIHTHEMHMDTPDTKKTHDLLILDELHLSNQQFYSKVYITPYIPAWTSIPRLLVCSGQSLISKPYRLPFFGTCLTSSLGVFFAWHFAISLINRLQHHKGAKRSQNPVLQIIKKSYHFQPPQTSCSDGVWGRAKLNLENPSKLEAIFVALKYLRTHLAPSLAETKLFSLTFFPGKNDLSLIKFEKHRATASIWPTHKITGYKVCLRRAWQAASPSRCKQRNLATSSCYNSQKLRRIKLQMQHRHYRLYYNIHHISYHVIVHDCTLYVVFYSHVLVMAAV